MRLFPVNSSAPPTITRINPKLKAIPPISFVKLEDSVTSDVTVVAKIGDSPQIRTVSLV